jgi:beta-lactam-binding protein with PASTA domain
VVDVLGQDLHEARRALEAAGFRVVVSETRTSRSVRLSGPLRVVRQRYEADGVVELVVTHERYEPAGPERA